MTRVSKNIPGWRSKVAMAICIITTALATMGWAAGYCNTSIGGQVGVTGRCSFDRGYLIVHWDECKESRSAYEYSEMCDGFNAFGLKQFFLAGTRLGHLGLGRPFITNESCTLGFGVPLGWPMLIGWILCGAMIVRYRRRRRRLRVGACLQCGYDLTGNASGRCPECGSEVSHNKPNTAGELSGR